VSGTYSAGDIEASLKLDRSEFNRELTQAKRDAEDFQKQTYKPRVSLDDTEAKTKIQALKDELQSLHNITVSAALSGFDSASTHLAALQAQADHLNGMVITIYADVDTTAAAASLTALRAAASDNITIHADVDTRVAAASLARLRAAAADPINIPTGGGDPGGPAPRPRPGVPDGDDERNRKLKDPFKIPGALFSLPGLIASVLPQLPALTTLLGGATAAVVSFGVAAGGALGVYGAATMGAVKQATAHKKAVESTGKALEAAQARLAGTTAGTAAYTNALKAVTEAEKAHKEALKDLTPAEKQFTDSLNGVQTAWQSFIKSTEVYTLKPVATVLDGAKAALPQLIPLVKDLAPAFQSVAVAMKNWLSGDGLHRFVYFLRTTGVPIVLHMIAGFRTFMAAGGALMRAFGPIAVKMSEYFETLGKKSEAWAQGGGVLRFRDHFFEAWHQLKPIFSELITLVGHIWEILQGTGSPNANALVGVLHGLNTAIGNLQPAAVKSLGEIFQSISDVAIQLAPVIGITSKAIVDIINVLPPGTIRAIADAMIAWKLAVLGWNAAIAAWAFLTSIIAGLTLAWRTLSFVFAASPIGVIVTGLILLVGIIVLIATKTTWFQTLWKYTWEGIKIAAHAVWVNVLQPTFHGIWVGLQEIGKWGVWLWNNALKPAWNGIASGASWLWGYLKPVLVGIGNAFMLVGKVIWIFWSTYAKVVFIIFEAAIKALWLYVLKPVFGWIAAGWHALGTGVMWVWHHLLKPAWDLVVAGAIYVWNHGVKPAIGWITAGWHAVGDGVMWVWRHLLKPAWDMVSDGATKLWKNYISPVFNGIKNTISDKWDWIKAHVFSPMGDFFTKKIPGWADTMKGKLVTAFDTAWKGIQKVWDNVKKAIGSPIYLVAKYVWNDAIYGIMDKISGFVHQKNPLGKIPLDNIPHFAAGGPVRGGTPGKDSVLSMLMPDEHVLTREDVAAMGGQHAVARFRSALHGGAPVQGANNTGHFGIGGWIGDAGSALAGTVSKGLGVLKDAVLGAVGVVVNPLLNAAEKTVDKLIPANGGWENLANGTLKQPIEWIKGFINKEDKKAQSVGGVIPAGQHLAIIDAALKAAGAPPPGTKEQWEAGMNTLIQRESGWNASAINNWDSNAKAGHPSQGLTQTIPSTFNAYVPPALRSLGILNPIANVAASVRYIKSVYGGIQNVQQANANKAPKGYWTGTSGAAPGMAWVGERGPELIDFHGGETVYNNGDSMRMLRSGLLGGLHGYASGTAKQRSTVRRTYHELDSDTARRNAAQKAYNAAHTKYLNATTAKEQQAARKEMDKYQKRIDNANKEIAADNKLIKLHDKKYKAASDAVRRERADAAALAAARKKKRDAQISAARTAAQNFINNAKAKIDAKLQVATDARNGYYDAAKQSGQLTNLTGNRAAGFTQQLQAKITAIKNFQANLHKLATLGLSQGVIQQIAAMGADQGGALAQSLARTTTAADAKGLNAKYAELDKVAGQYADSAANDGYGLSSLKAQSAVLSKTKITVTAPNTIMVTIDGKTFKAHTEKVVESKVTEIVDKAGKKK
jgi:SLT domain-containing protein